MPAGASSRAARVFSMHISIRLDNLEGVTLGPPLAGGRKTLVLISYDNSNASQRTQVLAFTVPGPPPARSAGLQTTDQ